jgi:hypothetical protein
VNAVSSKVKIDLDPLEALYRDYDDCFRQAARHVKDGHAPKGFSTLVQVAVHDGYSPRAIQAAMGSFYARRRSPEYWMDAFESSVKEQQARLTGRRRKSEH